MLLYLCLDGFLLLSPARSLALSSPLICGSGQRLLPMQALLFSQFLVSAFVIKAFFYIYFGVANQSVFLWFIYSLLAFLD